MRILTWNVLHRVHAETHAEPAIERWPGEAERVRALGERLLTAMTVEGVEVALLQEVSGDVLTELRTRLPAHAVLNHCYPRVPKQKSGSVLDATEHLVIIAPPGTQLTRAHTFASDPGKGYLVAELPGGARVGSTHVSWGVKGAAQLGALAQLFAELDPLCVGGDFNCGRAAVAKCMSGVTLALPPAGSLCTRPDTGGGEDIDHLLCTGGEFLEVQVLEHGSLSDHRPLVATLQPLPA